LGRGQPQHRGLLDSRLRLCGGCSRVAEREEWILQEEVPGSEVPGGSSGASSREGAEHGLLNRGELLVQSLYREGAEHREIGGSELEDGGTEVDPQVAVVEAVGAGEARGSAPPNRPQQQAPGPSGASHDQGILGRPGAPSGAGLTATGPDAVRIRRYRSCCRCVYRADWAAGQGPLRPTKLPGTILSTTPGSTGVSLRIPRTSEQYEGTTMGRTNSSLPMASPINNSSTPSGLLRPTERGRRGPVPRTAAPTAVVLQVGPHVQGTPGARSRWAAWGEGPGGRQQEGNQQHPAALPTDSAAPG